MKPVLAWAALVSLAGCLAAGEPPATLDATAVTEGTRVRFLAGASHVNIVEIQSESGIGRATVRRGTAAWPPQVTIRLHLRGLESLCVQSGETTIVWSMASHGNQAVRVSLRTPKSEIDLNRDSAYFADLRIVGKRRTIPLEDGFFEVVLPQKLLASNPASIALSWIDFYR